MGAPVAPNGYELGTACTQCLGSATPKRFLAIVQGITKCPFRDDPPNGFYILSQISACSWKYDDGTWSIIYYSYWPAVPDSNITILKSPGWNYFTASASICAVSFTNVWTLPQCGGMIAGYGGTVRLIYGPGI